MNTNKLLSIIESFKEDRSRPDGSSYASLLLENEIQISKKTGCSLLEIESLALKNNITPERYCRNQNYLSPLEQLQLLESHVAIIGLGGLGGAVTEILARLGVGSLTLVDGDTFDESNLNRQVLSSINVLGERKTTTAKKRVSEINPATTIHDISEFLTKDNNVEILQGTQLAIDCLDSIKSRFILQDGCKQIQVPMISAAIGGTSGQATTVFPEDVGLETIYGSEGNRPKHGIEASLGTLGFTAMYMATLQCAEATRILLKNENNLREKLLIAQLDHLTTHTLQLSKGSL